MVEKVQEASGEWLAGLADTQTENPISERPKRAHGDACDVPLDADISAALGTPDGPRTITNLDARRRRQLTKMKKLFDQALDEIDDRLKGGDWVITKEGSLVRQPVRAADLVKVANALANQVNLLEGRATAIVGADARLESLALKLRALAVDPTTSARIIEGERVIDDTE